MGSGLEPRLPDQSAWSRGLPSAEGHEPLLLQYTLQFLKMSTDMPLGPFIKPQVVGVLQMRSRCSER